MLTSMHFELVFDDILIHTGFTLRPETCRLSIFIYNKLITKSKKILKDSELINFTYFFMCIWISIKFHELRGFFSTDYIKKYFFRDVFTCEFINELEKKILTIINWEFPIDC